MCGGGDHVQLGGNFWPNIGLQWTAIIWTKSSDDFHIKDLFAIVVHFSIVFFFFPHHNDLQSLCTQSSV